LSGGTLQASLADTMKTIKIIAFVLGVSSIMALPAMSGPTVIVQVGPPVAPVVVAPAPAPAVTVEIGVPDTYVWDGYEYVGVVGTQYYYLGAGSVWLPFDSVRLARFHDWERIHADWRDHAIRNENYRNDAHGHEVPLRAPGHDDHLNDHSHDMDNHDPGHDH
jgi:hypothetical protein